MVMIEKMKKHIINSAEDIVLNIDKKDIDQYLSEVKEIILSLTAMDFLKSCRMSIKDMNMKDCILKSRGIIHRSRGDLV